MDLIQNQTHSGAVRIATIRNLIEAKNNELLTHKYFKLCKTKGLTREQVVELLKQVYCFSTYFERLMMRVIAEYSTAKDPRVLSVARKHLKEETGHIELFRDCLIANGIPSSDLPQLAPKMFTKALFGYLNATIQYENEYVSSVAIIQVMESIGYHFFSATLKAMQAHAMEYRAFEKHALEDEMHAELGVDLIADFDDHTTLECQRMIHDLYRLMSYVLDEWIGDRDQVALPTRERKRRGTRPPRSN